MRKVTLQIVLLGFFIFTLSSCHKDQAYHCYLVEDNWPEQADTLSHYSEGIWITRTRPEEECKVDWADQIILNQYNSDYSCNCLCGMANYKTKCIQGEKLNFLRIA